ncbi:hypothetical protein ACOMHN_017739 [Nucella lapillus]
MQLLFRGKECLLEFRFDTIYVIADCQDCQTGEAPDQRQAKAQGTIFHRMTGKGAGDHISQADRHWCFSVDCNHLGKLTHLEEPGWKQGRRQDGRSIRNGF